MRIRIDFADANKHINIFEILNTLEDNDSGNINSDNIVDSEDIDKKGFELKDILTNNYFNGADDAVEYIGYDPYNEYFEFELIPN